MLKLNVFPSVFYQTILLPYLFTQPSTDMIQSAYNILYAGFIPLLVLVLWSAAFQPGVHKAHVTILGLLVSLLLASVLTDIVKNAVGRPRPDLLARCKPAKGTPAHELVTIDVCTEKDHHTLHDGWRSFPSGHSAFAFGGLGFLALYVFASRSPKKGTNLRQVLCWPDARIPAANRSSSGPPSIGPFDGCRSHSDLPLRRLSS